MTLNALAKSIGDMNNGKRKEHQQAFNVDHHQSNSEDYEDINYVNRNQGASYNSYQYQPQRDNNRQVRFYDDTNSLKRPPYEQ